MIQLLDQDTINQIAAGEVVERPSSVVKELVENAMDAGATAITVEIKEGGLSFIRITDNGCGISKDQIPVAFLRHATSKITCADDLLSVASLGFRGEALASIAAVAQVEMITKTKGSLTGTRYEIHGGEERALEEIGCPEGTTLIIRNLFYNTPARKKFMKSAMTEGSYIQELIMRLAMSKPHIAMQFIMNGQTKLSTSGNGRLKEVIYQMYGRDITANLIEVNAVEPHMRVTGYIGKPFVNKGNRSFENYFVNGRYMKNQTITRAIEEAYRTFVMVHKFPFVALSFELEPSYLDINVHPTKMEMRYQESDVLYRFIHKTVREALLEKELIPSVTPNTAREDRAEVKKESKQLERIEPFEAERKKLHTTSMVAEAETPYVVTPRAKEQSNVVQMEVAKSEPVKAHVETLKTEPVKVHADTSKTEPSKVQEEVTKIESVEVQVEVAKVVSAETKVEAPALTNAKHEQMEMFEHGLLTEEARPKHRLIGQLFKTYWLIEYEKHLYIMDQHAAHEKVMYEGLMEKLRHSEIYSQQLMPPMVVTLLPAEADALGKHMDLFTKMGFTVESFGGNEYVIRSVPEDIFGVGAQDVFASLVAGLSEDSGSVSEELFVSKLSTMACKAAIKGNSTLSVQEADALVDSLLKLENPYNCPHGRPTIISMSETEIEKKFKRIQN